MKRYKIVLSTEKDPVIIKAASVDRTDLKILRFIRDDGTERCFNMQHVVSWEELLPKDASAPRRRPAQDPPGPILLRE